jgi:hypothetical protein
MRRDHHDQPLRCNLCRRAVDGETRERARWAFQPLVICAACVREADSRWALTRGMAAA